MSTPVGNPPLYGSSSPSNHPVEIREDDQPLDNSLEAQMNSLVQKIKKFIQELNGLPKFLQEMPIEKQEELQELTTKAHEMLKLHPTFNLANAKIIHEKMKEDLKMMVQEREKTKAAICKDSQQEDSEDSELLFELMNQHPLSTLLFDCGGLIKMEEQQMKKLELGIKEMDKVIRFQENPKLPLSEQIRFPLIEVSYSIQELLDSGLFK